LFLDTILCLAGERDSKDKALCEEGKRESRGNSPWEGRMRIKRQFSMGRENENQEKTVCEEGGAWSLNANNTKTL
jgi:hypothetical protein